MAPVAANAEEEGARAFRRATEEEERRAKREEKLEEMRVMAGLKNAREGIKLVRRNSSIMMEECSSTIADYYKSLDGKELSSHIKSRFDAWDVDKSHALDMTELTEAMAAMGKRPSPKEVEVLMRRVDKDGNGTVELDEFEHMVRESLGLRLEACSCRCCGAARNEAAEEQAAEDKAAAVAAKAEKAAAKLAAGAADPAPDAKGKAGKR